MQNVLFVYFHAVSYSDKELCEIFSTFCLSETHQKIGLDVVGHPGAVGTLHFLFCLLGRTIYVCLSVSLSIYIYMCVCTIDTFNIIC